MPAELVEGCTIMVHHDWPLAEVVVAWVDTGGTDRVHRTAARRRLMKWAKKARASARDHTLDRWDSYFREKHPGVLYARPLVKA